MPCELICKCTRVMFHICELFHVCSQINLHDTCILHATWKHGALKHMMGCRIISRGAMPVEVKLYVVEQYHKYGTALMQRRTCSRIFIESRAHVEQTYFNTLTAHRSGNRSCNTKLRHSIQL